MTQIDTTLQMPGLLDPDWQNLYALRKHLDDEQRQLVQVSINEADAAYHKLTVDLVAASNTLETTIKDLAKVSSTMKVVSQIASLVDQVLKLV